MFGRRLRVKDCRYFFHKRTRRYLTKHLVRTHTRTHALQGLYRNICWFSVDPRRRNTLFFFVCYVCMYRVFPRSIYFWYAECVCLIFIFTFTFAGFSSSLSLSLAFPTLTNSNTNCSQIVSILSFHGDGGNGMYMCVILLLFLLYVLCFCFDSFYSNMPNNIHTYIYGLHLNRLIIYMSEIHHRHHHRCAELYVEFTLVHILAWNGIIKQPNQQEWKKEE